MGTINLPYTLDKEFFRANDSSGAGPNVLSNNPRLPMVPWVLIQFRTATISNNQSEDDFMKEVSEGRKIFDLDRDSEWNTVSLRKADKTKQVIEDLYDNLSSNLNDSSLLFDNYFESIEIEDNGGFLKCNMKLFDKDFGRLESIITRSILSMKACQSMLNKSDEKDYALMQFSVGGPQSINFRIRYGYMDAISGSDSELFISDLNETDDGYKNRAKKSSTGAMNKMVSKSPWFYFQMMGCKFSVIESGMVANVEGISMGTSIFDRMKLVQRFSIMRGTPELLIKRLGAEFFFASGGKIQVIDDGGNVIKSDGHTGDILGGSKDDSLKSEYGITWKLFEASEFDSKYKDEKQRTNAINAQENYYRIEIQYGSEPRKPVDAHGKVQTSAPYIREYMSVKDLLNQLCSKVPPRYTYENNGLKTIGDTDPIVKELFTGSKPTITIGGETFERSAFKANPYTYSIKEMVVGNDRIIRIRFYYKSNEIEKQEYIRKYVWRNNSNSVITQFSINSDFDFAQMNQSIALIGEGKNDFFVSQQVESGTVDTNEGTSPAKIDPTKINFQKGFVLVSNMYDKTDGDQVGAATTAQALVNNMNAQIFKGSIEILGDPFYMFSNGIQPYQYGIYLEVLRDRNYYYQTLDEPLQKSYLSGLYLISKIRHTFSAAGFRTTLEVSKFPTDSVKLVERS